jgi:ankyrin repeat protein
MSEKEELATAEFIAAAKKGDYAGMEKAVQNGASWDTHYGIRINALMQAIESENTALCLKLIDKIQDLNYEDSSGKTALILAAEHGLEEVGLKLLEKGVEFISYDKNQRGALHYAAQKGLEKLCTALLDKGMPPDGITEEQINSVVRAWYVTPLMCAAESGQLATCRLLIKRGATINAAYAKNRNAFFFATDSGNSEVCKLLIEEGIDIHAVDHLGNTTLCAAAVNGLKEICGILIEKKFSPNQANDEGVTPLICAADKGDVGTCQLLLDKGAVIDTVDKHGHSALNYAIEAGNRDAYDLLLTKGIDINVIDNDGNTPLIIAADYCRYSTCEDLIARGAYVDHVNNRGKTALSLAIHNGSPATAKVLLRAGATLPKEPSDDLQGYLDEMKKNARQTYGSKTPLDRALYLTSDGKPQDSLLDACVSGQFAELIAAPLQSSPRGEERALFRDIFKALPKHWRERESATHALFTRYSRAEGKSPPSASR